MMITKQTLALMLLAAAPLAQARVQIEFKEVAPTPALLASERAYHDQKDQEDCVRREEQEREDRIRSLKSDRAYALKQIAEYEAHASHRCKRFIRGLLYALSFSGVATAVYAFPRTVAAMEGLTGDFCRVWRTPEQSTVLGMGAGMVGILAAMVLTIMHQEDARLAGQLAYQVKAVELIDAQLAELGVKAEEVTVQDTAEQVTEEVA